MFIGTPYQGQGFLYFLQTLYLFLIDFLPGPGGIFSPGHFPGGTVSPEGLCKIGFSHYRFKIFNPYRKTMQ